MTTLSMVAGGMTLLVFAYGANAISLQPMGWGIVGGVMTGNFFTLSGAGCLYVFCAMA